MKKDEYIIKYIKIIKYDKIYIESPRLLSLKKWYKNLIHQLKIHLLNDV